MAVTKQSVVIGMARTYWQDFQASRARAFALDAWATGKQYDFTDDVDSPFFGQPYTPRKESITEEYTHASRISPSAWGQLVVKSLSQTAYLDGISIPKVKGTPKAWEDWQRNRMDRKQIGIYKGAIGHGAAFAAVMPGRDPLSGDFMPLITPRSAMTMAAFYDDADDEYPRLAINAERFTDEAGGRGWNVTVYDETAEHALYCDNNGNDERDWHYISYNEHPLKVTPVTRCANSLDLQGNATGEIEGIIPILRRIDQTTFDRLIVQRFGAWKVRYIAGMAKPVNPGDADAQALALKIEDLLISSDPNTKFGTLDASDTAGYIASGDTDLRYLAAITQTPPHHLLGLSSNLQAEALAAAESGLFRKSADFKMCAGEFNEQTLALTAILRGNVAESRAFEMQSRWRETESRSFGETIQGLSLAATGLGIPIEMLWQKFPGWTDQDVARAQQIVQDGSFDKLIDILGANDPNANPTLDAEQQGKPSGQPSGS